MFGVAVVLVMIGWSLVVSGGGHNDEHNLGGDVNYSYGDGDNGNDGAPDADIGSDGGAGDDDDSYDVGDVDVAHDDCQCHVDVDAFDAGDGAHISHDDVDLRLIAHLCERLAQGTTHGWPVLRPGSASATKGSVRKS